MAFKSSLLLAACLVLACGGKSENDATGGAGGTGAGGSGGATGGSGGATGGTGGATGGTGGVLPSCEVGNSASPPFATTFRFTTSGTEALYLVDSCQLEWSLFQCSDGYTESVARSGACTVDCSETTGGCIACGACAYLAKPVSADAPVEDQWSGVYYSFGQTPDGCGCHTALPALSQKYRVKAKVYASEDDAMNGMVLREVSVDFELPAPYNHVEVPLD